MALDTGMVVAVPIPKSQQAEASVIESATQKALNEVVEKKVAGRDVTPYLLARVNELTGGKSLTASMCCIALCGFGLSM